ncbi:type II secretion system protein [Leifsonia sp. ku-ls]|nr:type II secretion system protein [Leifsonia sp. ku-ls]
MIVLRRRLRLGSAPDAGLTLIEVLVAMTIFGFVASGIALGLTSSMAAAVDNQKRITAASLAAAEIDRVRAIGDPFKVNSVDPGVTAGPDNAFTVTTDATWKTPSGSDSTCGTSGGPLQFRVVKVTVSWSGARTAVTSTTLIAPSGRINDPSMGTILVVVKNAFGRGAGGVAFTAGSLATSPTDADGCGYVLKVPPGTYTVTLNQAGYIDYQQKATPSKTADVTAGASQVYSFQYDKAATFTLAYGAGSPKLPTNLDTTFLNATYGGAFPPMKVSTATKQASLHPYKDGYQAVAGAYDDNTCPAPNPTEWAPDTRTSPAKVGTLPASQSAAPGGSASLTVPMGTATVSPGSGPYLFAVSQNATPVPGEPACAAGAMNYTFGSVIPASGGTGVAIALPYGTWQLYSASSATGPQTALTGGRVAITSNGSYVSSSGQLTLDPRS